MSPTDPIARAHADPERMLDLLETGSLPPERAESVIAAAMSAAEGLFDAGALERALAAWNLSIAALQRFGLDGLPAESKFDRYGHARFGRARTLDHLDDLDGALEGYVQWRDRLEAGGRDDMLEWADKHIARMRRKIARRDAGLSYRLHTRGVRPDALEWERERFRARLAGIPAEWNRQDIREARDAVAAEDDAAAMAADRAWRASADPAVVAVYDALQAQMQDLAEQAYTVRGAAGADGSIGVAMEHNEAVWAEGEVLGRRARQLRYGNSGPRRPIEDLAHPLIDLLTGFLRGLTGR